MLCSKKEGKYLCGQETQQNEVNWAKAEAYRGLVLEAASGNWKFSSYGILGLNNSTQNETKAGTQSQNLGQTN